MKRIAVALALCACALAGCAGAPPAAWPPAADTRPRVGLALGGGGARGFAEVGVIRALEREKVPIDVVAGTSVGSLVGALYADTGKSLDLELSALTVTDEDLFDYKALAILSGGFVKGERLEEFIGQRLRNRDIEKLALPYAAVATDLRTGETVVFDRGSVARAVHASAAIPGVFVPVTVDGRVLVDGGVTNPVPADVARRLGADVVIAVAIPAAVPSKNPATPIETAYHAVTIMAAEIGRLRAREADVLITPDAGDVAYDDFSRKKQLIEAGEAATAAAMPAIKAAIAAHTRKP
ncbi:MAG TPA: patatin-like phospholipase family protein [bacterium]